MSCLSHANKELAHSPQAAPSNATHTTKQKETRSYNKNNKTICILYRQGPHYYLLVEQWDAMSQVCATVIRGSCTSDISTDIKAPSQGHTGEIRFVEVSQLLDYASFPGFHELLQPSTASLHHNLAFNKLMWWHHSIASR